MNTAIVIGVKELNLSLSFYRDILQLGEPEFVSSFGCGFHLNENTKLILLLSRARYLEHSSSATVWSFEVPDLRKLEARLNDAGFPLDKEFFRLGCLEYRRGADPEGNCFYIRQAAK